MLGDYNEHKTFLPIMRYPYHFDFFSLHQENSTIHFLYQVISQFIHLFLFSRF